MHTEWIHAVCVLLTQLAKRPSSTRREGHGHLNTTVQYNRVLLITISFSDLFLFVCLIHHHFCCNNWCCYSNCSNWCPPLFFVFPHSYGCALAVHIKCHANKAHWIELEISETHCCTGWHVRSLLQLILTQSNIHRLSAKYPREHQVCIHSAAENPQNKNTI